MFNKILLFGLGKQGSNYYNYFKNKNFEITGINKSGKKGKILQDDDFFYSFKNIKSKNNDFFNSFNYIIVAVFPLSEQNKVLGLLLRLRIKANIIIEKPVTFNYKMFKKLLLFDNITFYTDEILLSNHLKKNITINSSIKIITILDLHVLEHSISLFLLFKDLKKYLFNAQIKFIESNIKEVFYNIYINNFIISNKKMHIYINDKENFLITFSESLTFLIDDILINNKKNYLYKENYLILNKFLKKIMFKKGLKE